MTSAPKVVEDGVETTGMGGDRTDRPRWGWLAVGLIIGAGLSVLMLRVGTQTPPTTSTVETIEAAPERDGIAGVVEGFPDGLVAVLRSDGQSLVLLTWPLRGEPFERTIPVGSSAPAEPVAFDVSGRHIATLLPVPGQDLGVLHAGIPQNAAIIATDVTGYAWHDSAASQLSYTTYVDGEMLLWSMSHYRADPKLVARSVGIEGRLAAWGEWGYAIQDDARPRIVLLTETGEIKDMHPGRVLDSGGTGWLAVDNDGIGLLSAGGGVRGLDREGLGAEVRAAQFSSDGDRLALLTADGALVLSLVDDSELISAGGRPGVHQLAWSSDGRFVLYPAAVRGLEVIDAGTGDAEKILVTRTLTGVGILPLSSA